MKNKIPTKIVAIFIVLATCQIAQAQNNSSEGKETYTYYVQKCIDNLLHYGTDRYGEVHSPMLVSILDTESKDCPRNPKKLDEYFRVTRRDRRNPAGSNLYTDHPTFKSLYYLSQISGDKKYGNFANSYAGYVMNQLVDKKGFFWWGIHRHYDVFTEEMTGHGGNHHEIQAITHVDWDHLWEINKDAVTKHIEATWEWHVIDKKTGEVNRHGDGKAGCDFSMSAGTYIEAFTFLHAKTSNKIWLDRAYLLADYYWDKRNKKTNLFPDRPNAGVNRFDGSSFVTNITGLFCHSLLKAYELTGEDKFKNQAITYLEAYLKYGYDKEKGKFWGALQLNGKPIPGPRVYTDNIDSQEGYAANQPRGHLDLWEPYMAGYQYAIYTAQAYIYAYQLSNNEKLLEAAKIFANWIEKTPPGTIETEQAWYKNYSNNEGLQGTYAGKYGRTISFFNHLYIMTENPKYFKMAQHYANMAIEKLYVNGFLKGHPAKPYYEAMDGVGYLLYALLQTDQIAKNKEAVLSSKKIVAGKSKVDMPLDNW